MKKYVVAYIKAYVDLASAFGMSYLFYTCFKGRSPLADYLLLLINLAAFAGPLSLLIKKKESS